MTAVAIPPSPSIDLVRFLLARLDDEDAADRRAARAGADTPERLHLRLERESKRKIVACTQQLILLRDQPAEKPVRDAARQILRAMIAPYHEHTTFRPEWAARG